MSGPSEPRGSTNRETAPLLQDPDITDENEQEQPPKKSFTDQITALAEEPLTPLTRLLLFSVLALLLLTSIFIGLFAGAQHRLNAREGHGGEPTETNTVTATYTATTTSRPVPTEKPQDVCTTAECVIAAARILSGLDESKDPCNDMYEFSNGGWIATHDLPVGKSEFSMFEDVSIQNKRIIREIVNSSSMGAFDDQYDAELLEKLRGFYSSCMNEDLLEEIGLTPLLEIVKYIKNIFRSHKLNSDEAESHGQMSFTTEGKRKSSNHLTSAIAYVHSLGVSALFDFQIDGDVGRDPDAMSLWFDQPKLGLGSKEYYYEKELTDAYQNIIVRILDSTSTGKGRRLVETQSLKVLPSDSWPEKPWPPWGDDDGDDDDGKRRPGNSPKRNVALARDVIAFERKIAEASLDLAVNYQEPFLTYNPISFTDFTESLQQIQFSDYLTTMTPRSFPEFVIVRSPSYMHNLSAILDETPEKVVEAYLITRVSLTLAPALGKNTEVWQAVRFLEETLKGIKHGDAEDRSEWCLQAVENELGYLVGRYFIQKAFRGRSRERGIDIITSVISAFKESLKHIEWMDQETAKLAAKKADSLHVKVGYPNSPNLMDARSLVRNYSPVKIDERNFFRNVLNVTTFKVYGQWFKLGKQRDKDAWVADLDVAMVPSTVNAYFEPSANDIVFPAGIMRPPFFAVSYPAYIAYGSFGSIAAHELTHAFDSQGRMYNAHGKLEIWWTNETSEAYEERRKCLAEQYTNYTMRDGKGGIVHVNGNLTSAENIGDTGAIQAYRAWRAKYDSSYSTGQEFLLPGLYYTREQLFFIAFAQTFVRISTPEAAVNRLRTDPHSPSRYRVEGTLYNMPEFAVAFNCPSSAKLNPPPEKRCRFW